MKNVPEIPGYYIKKEIGHGGMGKIYEAVDRIRDRKVALKIFIPAMAAEKEARARFIAEGEILSKLNHKNIVPVYDVGSYGEINYISVEFLEGKSLKERIHPLRGDRIPVAESLRVIREIAGALAYSHTKGMIHRDIKPENILFRNDNTPVLVDFGIAKDFSTGKNFTMTGTSIGTPYYMSPEQIKGLPPDGRNDIYSLGVVLYEMLTGDIPYKGTDIISVAMKHERDPIPKLPPKLSRFQELIDRMMAKRSADRPAGGNEVIRLIEKSELKELPDLPEPVRIPKLRKLRRLLLKFVIFILVFLIPIVTGYIVRTGEDITLAQKSVRAVKTRASSESVAPSPRLSQKKPDISLRSRARVMNDRALQRLVRKHNFFDSDLNSNGNFINRYRTEVIRQDKVVTDNRTGLMWHHRGSFDSLNMSDAVEWIRDLNKNGYAGFRDWRLPTLEEAYSLLEKTIWYGDLHIFSVFSAIQKEIWTSDLTSGGKSNWMISFTKGRARTVSLFRKKSYVRPVRKI
jgi:serine/threonine protein kinase